MARKRKSIPDEDHTASTASIGVPNSLRRSSRGVALKSGPQSYSQKWHPLDDFKSPSKSQKGGMSTKRTESPSFEADDNKIPTPPTHPSQKSQSRLATKLERPTPIPSRRSSRIVHDADIAMKYDMSSHWSSRKFTEPRAFARRLEERRRSLASSAPKDDVSHIQNALPPLEKLPDLSPDQEQSFYEDGLSNSPISGTEHVREQSKPPSTPNDPPVPASSTNLTDKIDQPPSPEHDSDRTPTSDLSTTLLAHKSSDKQFEQAIPTLTDPKTFDWNHLSKFDRRLYSLQKSNPANGNALPVPWSVVKQALVKEGFQEALDLRHTKEDSRGLANRYESLRLGIEAFFEAQPQPADKHDWILFQFEGFDVYDKRKGRMYWKRKEDNIIEPLQTAKAQEFLLTITTRDHEGEQHQPNTPARCGHSAEGPRRVEASTNLQSSSVDEAQIDNLLALAEAGETESLTSLNSIEQHGPSNHQAATEETHISPEQSEKALVDLMRLTDSVVAEAGHAIDIAKEIEDLLDEERPAHDSRPSSAQNPVKQIHKTTSPPIRRRRKVAQDFSIHEDETAGGGHVGGNGCRLSGPKDGLDLPVENMTTGELVPASQERTAIDMPSGTRYHLGIISLGGPHLPAARAESSPHASVFGGSYMRGAQGAYLRM